MTDSKIKTVVIDESDSSPKSTVNKLVSDISKAKWPEVLLPWTKLYITCVGYIVILYTILSNCSGFVFR